MIPPAVLGQEAAPQVGVVRLQLFKLSETFIPAQVESYGRYAPFYLGRKCFGSAPEGSDVACMPPGRWRAFRALLLRDFAPWQAVLRTRRPDLLHAHFAIDAAAVVPLAQRLGVPLVTTLHAFDVTKRNRALLASGKPNEVMFVLRRRALQREGALFVCVSHFIRQQALASGYPAERTVALPIGVDTEKFTPVPHAERQSGLIVHVARLVEKKGTSDLLQAFARIAHQLPHAQLVIIGDGPLRRDLEATAIRLGLVGRVQFLGPQAHAQTIEWISRAALVAVPSITATSGDVEGLPTVIFEAGALGVPVIGTLHAGIPEAIVDDLSGCLVPERAVAVLADRMARLVNDPARALCMGASARQHMQEHFDIRRQTEKLEALYDLVLAEHRTRKVTS